MIKLIASDLDGTIIGNPHSISKYNLKVIDDLHKNHIPFVICTGKTYAISKGICKDLHANFGIFGNGSQIINLATGEEIVRKTLSKRDLKYCFSVIKKHDLHTHIYTEDGIVSTNLEYMDLRNSILFPNEIQFEIVDSVFSYVKKEKATVFKLIISSTSSLLEIKQKLEKNKNLTVSHFSKTGIYKDTIINKEYEYLDISPRNVTKGSALQALSSHLNLEKDDILSIGDNLNDIDMFHASGIGAAVNNAYDEVKKVANYTTFTSAEDGGFAEAIYKFIPFG